MQLFSGTFSDRAGARRAYGLGMILFTVASLACGLSPNLPVLIAGRILQGVGAAMITPSPLALIREAYQDPAQRAGPSSTGDRAAQSRRRPARCSAASSPSSTGG